MGVLCLSLFCCALLCFDSSFGIILKRKRKLVALLLLSYKCIVTINVLWLFLMVPWVGLQFVFVVFPDLTHLLKKTVAEYDQEMSQSQTGTARKRYRILTAIGYM